MFIYLINLIIFFKFYSSSNIIIITPGSTSSSANSAAGLVNTSLAKLTGQPLSDAVLERALADVAFTPDPVAAALPALRDHAVAAGTSQSGSLDHILDLRALDAVLSDLGEPSVSDAGLGRG